MKKVSKIMKKGESLIESIISMFFIVTVIVPVSNLLLKTYSLNTKIDKENETISENKNTIEIIKTKTYEEIEMLEGDYEISNINEFYHKFHIDTKYRLFKNIKENKKRKIEIKKSENYYINNDGEKEYIFEIYVDNMKDFYFPRIE